MSITPPAVRVATTAEVLAVDHKRERLAKLLRERSGTRPAPSPDQWPLSYGQRAMWFMHLLDPTATAFNIGEAMVLRGPLDLPAMHRALARLVDRHRLLGTRIITDDHGEPLQQNIPVGHLRLSEVDATQWTDEQVVSRLGADVDRPFDLAAGPLLRLTLYRRGSEEHLALLTLHHIVGEFWTLVIVVGDLVALYRAEVDGVAPVLPPLARHYSEFASRQRELLSSVDSERLWRYWRAALDGEVPALHLPTDRPRPAARTFTGALRGFQIGAGTARRLREFSRAAGVTTYQALLAAFGVFLQRHCNQQDLVIGSPMTGRLEAQWAAVAGYFDNPLPVRLALDPQASFTELVGVARTAALGAFAHQAMPFPLLVERLRVRPDPGRSPLFDVMFVLRRAQSAELGGLAAMAMGSREGVRMTLTPELQAESLELPRRVSQYDLTLSLAESATSGTADGIGGSWEYSTDLFDVDTIDRFSDRFTRLLAELLAAPDRPVAALPMLAAGELRQVVREWNDTAAPLPADHRLHGGFAAAAAAQPDAVALVGDGVRISYAELDRDTGTIAGWLQQTGVQPGELVAICMRKGWQQVAAAIGILKSGAAYLPVDATLPARRVAELLQLGGVGRVLVQPETVDTVPADFAGHLFPVSADRLAAAPRTPVPVAPDQDTLAYVIFTSGSTGTPKGVMIDHLGAANTIHDINSRFGITGRDRVFALSSLSFDLSVYDIFGTLAAGGTIVMPSAAQLRDPAAWLELARTEQITVWNSVPALAQLLTDEADAAALASIRVTMLSGDWIPLGLADQLRGLRPGMQVHSLGGATEASIWSIHFPVGPVDPQWTSIPYGRPMANQRFFVLGDGDQPCPPGVTGQLHIGGVGLAKGYWRDEPRTRERFFEHPELGRLYRTGDLGRYGADGCIEFLGRQDHQVKIRGFRVELGEVEAAIREHPGVRDAVVLAVGEREARRLVGFALAVPGAADGLKEHCAARLPGYMVPTVLIGLSEFPLTGNGKVDHAALTELARSAPEPSEPQGPVDSRHELLCRTLADLLGRSAVGATDNFFQLGGDSVVAIRLCAAARRAGLVLTPDQVFAHPSVAELVAVAGAVDGLAQPGGTQAGAEPAGGGLSPMQQTMLLHAATSRSPRLYCEQVRIELAGSPDASLLRSAWQHVVDRHPALRARFEFDAAGNPARRFGVQQVAIEVVDLRSRAGELAAVLEADQVLGFTSLDGPLMRWTLVHLADDHHELVWTHHHLLLDGWSLTIVLSELVACYGALLAGREPGLADPPDHGDYLDWLATSAAGRSAEPFWRSALDGLDGPTRLPREVSAAGFEHAERELELTLEQTAAVASRAAELGVTVNTLVQGAWALTLSRWTGDAEVVFGVTTTGRPAEVDGVESMVGLFINTVPLRVPVPLGEPVGCWLRDVQQRQAAASAHDTALLADVERWSGLPRSAGELALFDSVVVFENYPTAHDLLSVGDGGLSIRDVSFSEVTEAPITLYALPGSRLTLRAAFDSATWSLAWMGEVLTQLRTVLLELAASAERPVAAVLTAAAAHGAQAILQGDALPVSAPPVEELIHSWAIQRPAQVAVEFGAGRLTYGELVRTAKDLAARLVEHGAGPDTVVGVLLPRGVEAVVAVLGVLFAGAGYLPLDPEQPGSRTAEVLDQADPVLLVTVAAYADQAGQDRPIVLLGERGTAAGVISVPNEFDGVGASVGVVGVPNEFDETGAGVRVVGVPDGYGEQSAAVGVVGAPNEIGERGADAGVVSVPNEFGEPDAGGRVVGVPNEIGEPGIGAGVVGVSNGFGGPGAGGGVVGVSNEFGDPDTAAGFDGIPNELGGLGAGGGIVGVPDEFAERTLAYLVFTSGSTGRPNGVAVDRGALAHFVAAAARRYRIGADARVLQFAPLSFDASVEEIFVTLCAGATLVVRDEEMLESAAGFLQRCADLGITVLDLPTAFWHLLVDDLAGGAAALPATVDTVIIGGEAVQHEAVRRWEAAVPPTVRLFNTYGPTEATVVATAAALGGPR